VPGTASRAGAAEDFTFYGGGWGHGAGMSQHGVYGLAMKGRSYREVLKHYYRGVGIGRASMPMLRVGLTQDQGNIQMTAVAGKVRLRLGSEKGSIVTTIPAGETYSVAVAGGRYVIRDQENVMVGAPIGGSDEHLFATYVKGSRVFSPQAGHTYNRGYLEFNLYGSSLRLIAVVPGEAYLYGLGEMPSSWPAVALRAQATAARTYALEKISRLGQNRAGCNCGLLDSVADQNYVGYDKEGGFLGERWVGAVDATRGHVLRFEGSLIQAFYSSSSGGFTEHSENVFSEKLPYIRATCDPGDYIAANPNRVWKAGPFSAATMTAELIGITGDIGTVVGFSHAVRGPSDRLMEITVEGEDGEAIVTGNEIRLALGLKSTRFWINRDLTVTGAIRKRYDALGCRPGSATSPRSIEASGSVQRFEKGAIYRNRDARATVWLRGPVYDKYIARREWKGILRWPTSGVRRLGLCKKWDCSKATFERGRIYRKSKPGVGVHALFGPVLRYYLQVGGASGRLGFPVRDVVRSDGSSLGRFEGGTIRCDAYGACRG